MINYKYIKNIYRLRIYKIIVLDYEYIKLLF